MTESDRTAVYVNLFKDRHDGGDRIELILPGDGWTFEEAKIAKNMSEGMSPAQIEGSLLEGDPDAWLAVLRVSYLRADKEFPNQMIQGEDVVSLMADLAKETREAMRRRPPTSPNENGSGEQSAPATTESTPAPS